MRNFLSLKNKQNMIEYQQVYYKQKREGGEKMLKQKAQSTLEYVLVITAIIAAVIIAAGTFVRPRVQSSLNHVTNQMQTAVEKINLSK